MADLTTILSEIFANERQRTQATNPYLLGASALQPLPDDPRRKPETTLIANTLLGLAKGGLSGYGVESANSEFNDYLRGALPVLNDPRGSYDKKYSPVVQALAGDTEMRNRNLQNTAQNDFNQLQQSMASRGMAITGEGVVPIPGFAESEAALARTKIDSLYGGAGQPMATPAETMAPSDDDPLSKVIGPSAQDKYQEIFKQNVLMGMTPNEASQAARQQVAGRLKNDKSAMDAANKAREDAAKLSELAEIGKAGVANAGPTGPGTGLLKFGADVGSLVSDGMAQTSEGYGVLDSILPKLVAYGRPPGAFTEREWGILARSGPSTRNTRATNAALIEQFELAAQRQSQYADLIDTVLERGGSFNDATKLWTVYRQKVPLFKQDQTGRYVVNKSAPDWRTFFSGDVATAGQEQNGAQQTAPSAPPMLQPTPMQAAPSAGRGPVPSPGPAPRYSAQQLQQAGYTAADIAALQQQGVVD